jgi:hypothetical protein
MGEWNSWINPEEYEDAILTICDQIKSNIDAGHYESIMGIKFDVKKTCQNHWMTTSFKGALQVLLHSGNSTKSNNVFGEYNAIDAHVMDSAKLAMEHDVLNQLEDLSELMPQFICCDCAQTVHHVDGYSKRCDKCSSSFGLDKHWGIWFAGDPEHDDPAETPGWCTENTVPEFFETREEAEDRMNSYWKLNTPNAHKYSVHLRMPSGSHLEWVEKFPDEKAVLVEHKIAIPEAPKTVIEEVLAEIAETEKIAASLDIFD